MTNEEARDALARALHDAQCGCGNPEATTYDYAAADAILSSDWLRSLKADVWDEGHLAGIRDLTPYAPLGDPNPYRVEGGENRG